jgi:autoinducer 2-degrading protein
VLVVHVHVKAESIEAFRAATVENACNSVLEPGIASFVVVQQKNNPSRFVLVEAYRDAEAPARHKETVHYQAWRDAVASMMDEPRNSQKYTNIFPEDSKW